jgi:hypothetical protein
MSSAKQIGDILILLGGIIGLIEGILLILGWWTPYLPGLGVALLGAMITGILGIIFSLIALVNSGSLKIKALEFKSKWLIVIIMGILMYLFSSQFGGILTIIGSLLLLVK